MNNDSRFSKITSLINYAVRMRSTNYAKNSEKYSDILEELKKTVEDYIVSQTPQPKEEPEKTTPKDQESPLKPCKSVEKLPQSSRRDEEPITDLKERLKLKLPWLKEEEKEESDKEEEPAKEEPVQEEKKKVKKVLRRYEKTFGKSKLKEKLKPLEEAVRKIDTPIPHPPKRREVIDKIKDLENQEQHIRKQKEELNKLLELRSTTSMSASRRTTVQSVTSQKRRNLPLLSRRTPSAVSSRESGVFLTALKAPKKIVINKTDPVGELIKTYKNNVTNISNSIFFIILATTQMGKKHPEKHLKETGVPRSS